MDNVVKLDAGRAKGGRRRPRRSKTALVLGGGGFTGAVYEIGALRALDLLSVNRTVNQFDIYVGTSAGSFVASLAANGVSPEEMMRVVNQQVPTPFRDIDVGTLLRPNLLEYARSGIRLPFKALEIAREVAPQLGQISLMDVVLGMGEALPSGVYSGGGVQRYIRDVLSDPDRSDDFRLLEAQLFLTATDLDTCERIVFGTEGWDDVPISTAVRASTALPMVYAPVEVKGRELIDGGIVSTTNLDIAVENGAKFIVVVNPLVPFVNDAPGKKQRISQMGLPQIGYQTFKLMAYQRLHEMARRWEERYPGVDIVLIEPEPNDELMFQTSIMNFTKRVQIAKHGFQSVTLKLASDYESFREVCERHGIEISATRVRKVVKHFAVEREKTRAWRKILEQTTGALLRQSANE
ncbi:MAG: patatin-like phospholipase family protein [Actinomycetota bacterium]|nr:patatin-like phospholipase family protein [Actinomycetota bacterium]